MSDLEKIICGGFFAIIVYVIGQLISKIFLDPLQGFRKIIGEIRFNLAFHAQVIHTPISRTVTNSELARHALLKNSCDLITQLELIPLKGKCLFLYGLPDIKRPLHDKKPSRVFTSSEIISPR